MKKQNSRFLVVLLLLSFSSSVHASVHPEKSGGSHKAETPSKKGTEYIALPSDLFAVPKVQAPELISFPEPEYPYEYKIRGITGEAVVELLVTAEGMPKYVGVISSTAKPFGEALKAAVEQAKFQPGTANGVATAVKIKFPYSFKIKTEEEGQ